MGEDSSREADDRKKVQRAEHQSTQPGVGLEGLWDVGDEPAYSDSLLGDLRLGGRGNQPVKSAVLRQAQETYGNRAVQRYLHSAPSNSLAGVSIPTTAALSASSQVAISRQADGSSGDQPDAAAQSLLEQAIAIVEGALAASTAPTAASGPPPTSSGGGPAAARDQGEVNSTPADEARPNAEQMGHLNTALIELQALKRSGRSAEIRAACEPIVQAAQGAQSGASLPAPTAAPVQRQAAVLAAPLLAGGPPGWAAYAGIVVFSLVVTGVVVYEASRVRARERDEPQVDPRVLPRTRQPIMHMGNIHVQGDDMREPLPNFPWNRSTPMTKAEALAALATLRGMLSTRQVSFRDVAFLQAARFINNTLYAAPPPLFRTFQNPDLIDDPRRSTRRVDIEIIRGGAFV